MPWYSKELETPFDTQLIEGLTYLNGDVMARLSGEKWVAGQKYPMLSFPSGLTRELWDSPDSTGIVHIWGSLELFRQTTLDEAYATALAFAEPLDYRVIKY